MNLGEQLRVRLVQSLKMSAYELLVEVESIVHGPPSMSPHDAALLRW
jgi:hypothetical protein